MTLRSFNHIGKFVRESRLNHPQFYSQNQLSKLLGYKNGQFISNVERGLCGIPLKGISKLIEVLGLSEADLKAAMQRDYEETLNNFLNNPDGVDEEEEEELSVSQTRQGASAQLLNA
ncbi:MAG: hypothetical protein CME71_11955 [Halobacteriovorax sp.]|nr:hypothetical protein [Halobacteriovorax sp.]